MFKWIVTIILGVCTALAGCSPCGGDLHTTDVSTDNVVAVGAPIIVTVTVASPLQTTIDWTIDGPDHTFVVDPDNLSITVSFNEPGDASVRADIHFLDLGCSKQSIHSFVIIP